MFSKRISKSLLPLCFAISLGTTSLNSIGGVPTYDAPNLAQALATYVTIIETYEETFAQTVLNESQLSTMIDQYTQILKEYDLFLQQARALKNKMDPRNYEEWAKTAMLNYKFKPFSFDDIRIATDEYSQAGVDSSNARYGERSNKAELDALATQVYGYTPDSLTRSYNHANMAADQHKYNKANIDKNIQTIERIEEIDNKRNKLGDKSQLATLQLIAEQNQLLIEQNQISNDLRQKEFEISNQFENQYFSNMQQAEERQLKRFIKEKNTPIIYNDTQMVP